jgi:hypothetical protein
VSGVGSSGVSPGAGSLLQASRTLVHRSSASTRDITRKKSKFFIKSPPYDESIPIIADIVGHVNTFAQKMVKNAKKNT